LDVDDGLEVPEHAEAREHPAGVGGVGVGEDHPPQRERPEHVREFRGGPEVVPDRDIVHEVEVFVGVDLAHPAQAVEGGPVAVHQRLAPGAHFLRALSPAAPPCRD
jgi:hypothetical protein